MKGMSTMIKIRIRNDDHEIDLQFPISENKLYAKLAEIHAIEGKDAPQSAFVTEVYWPEELSMLKDRFANLDELNYLARRMESFDYLEMGEQQAEHIRIPTFPHIVTALLWGKPMKYGINPESRH